MKKDLKKILMCLGLFLQTNSAVAIKKNSNKDQNSNKHHFNTKKGKNKSKKFVNSGKDVVDALNGGMQGEGTESCTMGGVRGEGTESCTMNGGVRSKGTESCTMNGGMQGKGTESCTMGGTQCVEDASGEKDTISLSEISSISLSDEPICSKPYSTLKVNKNAKRYIGADKNFLKNNYEGAKRKLEISSKKFSNFAKCYQGLDFFNAMRNSQLFKEYVKDTRRMIGCFQNVLDYEAQCSENNYKLPFSVKNEALKLESKLSKFYTKNIKEGEESVMLNVLTEFDRYENNDKPKSNPNLNVKDIKSVANNHANKNTLIKAKKVEEADPVKVLPKKVEEKDPAKPVSKSEKQGNRKPLSNMNKNQSKILFEEAKLSGKAKSESDLNASQISVSSFADYINIAGYVTYGICLDDYNITFSGYLSAQVHGFSGGVGILTNFCSINDAEKSTKKTTLNWINNIKVLLLVGCYHVGYKNLGSANLGLDFKAGLVYSLTNFFENEYLASCNVGLVGGITGKAYEGGLMIYAPKGISIFVGYHYNR